MQQPKRVNPVDYVKVEKLIIRFSLASLGIGLILATIIMCIIFKFIYDAQAASYEAEIAKYAATITNISENLDARIYADELELTDTIERYENRENYYKEQISGYQDEIEGLTAEVTYWSEEASKEREASTMRLADLKNWVYLIEAVPNDSILTVDHIQYSIEQCRIWNVNPQLMWGIYDIESEFDPHSDSPTSSARGLGQVLGSTASTIWKDVLGHGTYKHSYAYDPYVNIEISTCMIGRNLAISTLRNALDLYGDGYDSYPDRVLQAARNHGYEITESNARFT